MLASGVARVALVAVLATALPACSSGGDVKDNGKSLSDCAKTELVLDPVAGMTVDDVVLGGRLTVEGRPLEGQIVEFGIRESTDGPLLWTQTGRTRADGTASIDLADSIRRFQTARDAFGTSRLMQAEFVNPAEKREIPKPGWCSTKVRAPFDPKR